MVDPGRVMVMGLDLSLAQTGVVILDYAGRIVYSEAIVYKPVRAEMTLTKSGKSKTLTRAQTAQRLMFISDRINELRRIFTVTYAAREGYAFAKHSSSVTGLAELGGVVAADLFRLVHIPLLHLTVGQARKFTMGKGVASKALAQKWLIDNDFEFKTEDEGDAYMVAFAYLHTLLRSHATLSVEQLQYLDDLRSQVQRQMPIPKINPANVTTFNTI